MTIPDEQQSAFDRAEPGSEHDPEVAEAYAESVDVDPSQEVREYLKMAGASPLTNRL